MTAQLDGMPHHDSVEHRFVDLAGGVTIHVAVAGPSDGIPVMLVHGFPQNWWEWRALIGPLADAGYRVVCPDLRGAGWSSAPVQDRYLKNDMADDLAAIVERMELGPVRVVGHDWGGGIGFILMIRRPDLVAGFFGVNTLAPWFIVDAALARHSWRFWYQFPIALPVIGPRILADPRGRFFRFLMRWSGGGFAPDDDDIDLYVQRMRVTGHAEAGSRWYRTFQRQEAWDWMRGEYDHARISAPVHWLHGSDDPVITHTLLRVLEQRIDNLHFEAVEGVGHWFVEQRPDLLLNKVRDFLTVT